MRRVLLAALALGGIWWAVQLGRGDKPATTPAPPILPPVVSAPAVEEPPVSSIDVDPLGFADLPIKAYFPETGEIIEMPLEDFLKGVVAAEMPWTFELEALKAQMVAARTFTVQRMHRFGGAGCRLEPAADICADPRYDGQAYKSREQIRRELGPWNAYRALTKLDQAEAETRGLILTYEGKPIDALFHSTSLRSTASALEYYGTDVPYLQAVPDPHGSENPKVQQTVRIEAEQLAAALGLPGLAVPVAGGANPIVIEGLTPSGRVASVSVGSMSFTGRQFREKLGLRSTDFKVTYEDGAFLITTYGFGHGVGMSQYGAQGMAKAGLSFREILAHYYTGALLEPIFTE